MSIKNILVAYNGTESSDAAAETAVLMQKKYNAHVTGILTQHYKTPASRNVLPWMPEAIFQAISEVELEEREKIEDRFFDTTRKKIPNDHLHWIAERGDPNSTMANYSRLFDITVMGRRDVINNQEHIDFQPDRIALLSGRPILIIPKDNVRENFNDHAIVAWDGGRAASRALIDAMNILETKRLVTILTVDNGRLANPLAGLTIEDTLSRHGVETETVRLQVSRKKGTEGVILDYLNSVAPTLLVMGAHEHSKFSSQNSFGLSSGILNETKMTVFMSY